ncbi:hypothetical protein NLI96_g2685 [Meripilus lineatus]|uniref:Uncharacterized protein n=1 Tax=Meripilus lineatus TaxID=2056292 RepID=A0AAD5V9Q6_9APHY|nr:hypothetical protein NLI96_g2685 [Physisporinus lineatus]
MSRVTNFRSYEDEHGEHTEGDDSEAVVYISENPLAAGIVQDGIPVADQTSDVHSLESNTRHFDIIGL